VITRTHIGGGREQHITPTTNVSTDLRQWSECRIYVLCTRLVPLDAAALRDCCETIALAPPPDVALDGCDAAALRDCCETIARAPPPDVALDGCDAAALRG